MAEITDEKKINIFGFFSAIVIWAAMGVFAFHACSHMVAAGDTWVALACGRHFINHGVDTVEPFSANSHKAGPTEGDIEKWPGWAQKIAKPFSLKTVQKWHPTGWINQNWLTHVIFYWLVDTFDPTFDGFDGKFNPLVYWKFVVNLLTIICIYYTARLMGVTPLLAAAAASFALFIGRSFIDIRPAVFSNMLVAMYLLVLALSMYKNIRYIWLLVPLVVFWCNVHGRYIYLFIMLAPFVFFNFITIPFKDTFITAGKEGVYHAVGAGFASLVAMILFNPFHLTNLTHTFEISVSKHAESWRSVNEWRPAFDWMDSARTTPNPVGDEEAFGVMCIILIIALALYLTGRILRPVITNKRRARQNLNQYPDQYHWPKIDLPLIAISMLSLYLAVKSRRFIPIAATAGCPVIALFLQEAYCMISARLNFNKIEKAVLHEIPNTIRYCVLIFCAVLVIACGSIWAGKYKKIYLDPWPPDDLRDSVFMRMSASNVKPFDICNFIRQNELSGIVFNYWTEGGALAFGQNPDPETGKTPLQLFMDGRAQAAYNHDKFLLWQYIKSGGPPAVNVIKARRRYTNSDYEKIGDWIDEQMKEYDVWVIIMPTAELNSVFIQSIRRKNNWKIAYTDDEQHMFVNTDTEQGQKLISNIIEEKAKFPTEFSKNLTMADNLLKISQPAYANKGYLCAKKAFEIAPTQASVLQLRYAILRPEQEISTSALQDLKLFIEDFEKNKDKYSTKGGYSKKLSAAIVTANILSKVVITDNKKQGQHYQKLFKEYEREAKLISDTIKW